jgi:hypothetical protein
LQSAQGVRREHRADDVEPTELRDHAELPDDRDGAHVSLSRWIGRRKLPIVAG